MSTSTRPTSTSTYAPPAHPRPTLSAPIVDGPSDGGQRVRLRWTVRRRLLLGFGVLTTALLLAGGLGLRALGQVQRDLDLELRDATETGNLLVRSGDAMLRYVALAQARLLSADAGVGQRLDALAASADSLRTSLTARRGLTVEDRASIERLGALQGRIEVRLVVADAYRELGRQADASRQVRLATAALDSLVTESARVAAVQEARTTSTLARAESRVRRQRAVVGAVLAIGLGLAAVLVYLTWSAVARPLARLTSAARTLGEGDLRVVPDSTGLDEEYRVLADAFGSTIVRLRGMLAAIQREADDVASAADALTDAAEQTAAATGQISESASDGAVQAQVQRERLLGTADAVRAASDTAGRLEEAATASTGLAGSIATTAGNVRSRLADAVRALDAARDVITRSAAEMDDASGASESVGRLVAALEEIAGQTNLLALNAAIEAARAGEQGRGFAVVAAEVRQLAESSAEASREAATVVRSLRGGVSRAADAFAQGVRELGDVTTVSAEAAAALAALDDAVRGVESVTETLGTAATANGQIVDRLRQALDGAESQAESQAVASEETAASAQEAAAAAEEVTATAQRLATTSERLRELTSRFRV